MEKLSPETLPLPYAKPPARNIKKLATKWIAIAAAICVVWWMSLPVQRRIELRYHSWQRSRAIEACRQWKLPPDQPAYVEGAAAIASLYSTYPEASYHAFGYDTSKGAALWTREWSRFLKENKAVGGNITMLTATGIFTGELRTPGGIPCLVHVGMPGNPQLWIQVFDLTPAVAGSRALSKRGGANIDIKRSSESVSLKIFAGQIDPSNPSRVRIRFDYVGQPGEIVGELGDDFQLHLTTTRGWMADSPFGEWWLDKNNHELVEIRNKPLRSESLGEFQVGSSNLALAYWPDGKGITVVSESGVIAVSLNETPEADEAAREVVRFPPNARDKYDVQISPIGDRLVISRSEQDWSVHFIQPDGTWNRAYQWPIKDYPPAAIFSVDGSRLLVGEGESMMLFDTSTMQLLLTREYIQGSRGLSFTKEMFAHAETDTMHGERLQISQFLPGKDDKKLTIPGNYFNGNFSLSRNGKMIAVLSDEAWETRDTLTAALHYRFEWERSFVKAKPVWSPDGLSIAGASGRHIYLWKSKPKPVLYRIALPPGVSDQCAIAFSPDGKSIAFVSKEQSQVFIWHLPVVDTSAGN